MIVDDFNTIVLPIDRLSRQKLNGEILKLKDATNQNDLVDIYKNSTQTNDKEYTFLSIVHGTFSKMTTYMDAKQVSTIQEN